MRTRSLRNQAESATVISGDTKLMVVTSTIGRRASAAKLRNMPPAAISPRPRWPSGREVRSAAASSRRHA